jgi:predicted transcriptional regulator
MLCFIILSVTKEQVALNKSNLLLKISFKIHKHYNYLQMELKQELFTKDN